MIPAIMPIANKIMKAFLLFVAIPIMAKIITRGGKRLKPVNDIKEPHKLWFRKIFQLICKIQKRKLFLIFSAFVQLSKTALCICLRLKSFVFSCYNDTFYFHQLLWLFFNTVLWKLFQYKTRCRIVWMHQVYIIKTGSPAAHQSPAHTPGK